jgi:UDP-N-acetylmuramyl pentapeptide phosphotransferase/UDP-N-acetylglucosamine-1-phosphate transferase
MDGIDLISAAQAVPTALVILITSLMGILPPAFGLLAAMLLGVLLGFVPFNIPPARIFLGDSGSLPLGFLLGIMLYALAVSSTFSGALLLALYYLIDGITTILKRFRRGEKIWQAHREHAYQRAVHLHGWSVGQVSGAVFLLNLLFSTTALTLGFAGTPLIKNISLLVGIFCVIILLRRFEQSVSPM